MSHSTTPRNKGQSQAFAMVPAWVIPLLGTPSEWKVYAALATFADKSRQCWPKVEQIAERAGLHPRVVKRATRELEENGVIMKRSGRGRGRPNLYVLINQEPAKGVSHDTFSGGLKGDNPRSPKRVGQNDTKGDQRGSPPLNRPVKVKGYLGQEVAVGREGDSTGFGGSREGAEVIHLADLLQANRERQSSPDFSSAESAKEFAAEGKSW